MSMWLCMRHVRIIVIALHQCLETLNSFVFVEQISRKAGNKIAWTNQPNNTRWLKELELKLMTIIL